MIAVNMMSFTVYAAGDTVGGDKQENVSDNGDSDSSGSDNSDDGGSDAGADQGGSDAGADQGGSDAGADQGGSDAGADQGGSDAGSDQGGSDAGSDQGGSDAGSDQGGSDTGSDQNGSDAGSDQGGSNAGSDQGGSDAGSDQGGSDAGSDQGGSDAGSDQGGSNAGSDQGGSDAGSDQGGSDAGSDQGGNDAGSDQGGSDTGSDQNGSDAGSDQGGSDAGADQGGSDAGSDQGGSNTGSDQGGSNTGSDQGGSNAGSDQSGNNQGGNDAGAGQSADIPSGDQAGEQQSGSSESTSSDTQKDNGESKDSGEGSADKGGSQDNNAGSGSSSEKASGQSESGNENNTEDKGSKDTDSKDSASDAGSSGKTEAEVKNESAAEGTSTSGTGAASDKKENTTEEKDAAATPGSSTSEKETDKDKITDKASQAASEETKKEETAPTDEEIEDMLNESKRRTAVKKQESSSSSDSSSDSSSSSASWSNDPVIEDVMGIKASVQDGNVVISYKTKHSNPWEYLYNQYPITISYADGNGTNNNNTISFDWDGFGIHGDNWSQIDGVTISKSSDQNDTEYVTLTIPASWFESMDFTLSSGKYSTSISGEPIEQDDSQNNAVYEGIALDGTFNDWDAVAKSTLNEPNNEHNVEEVAWVIEKDYVYIYIKDDGSNSATWAGPNHNGKYAITTDLGRTLVFQLTEDGAVVGADGAVSNHTGSQWEIAIPTSSLPNNNGGLNFGLYLTDSTLEGYGDVSTPTSSTDIAYDGHYGDWDNYPHKEIQYATAGTHENVPDGEAAIYVDNNVYGHCETRMQAHLDEKGGEYTQAVSVIVNDDWSHALQMRLVTVDSAGNINWNPQRSEMENGAYEYYIFGIDCWGASNNINNLVDADVCYGKATVTLQDGRHDMEWYVDSAKLAARYGILETDMKTVSSQYGRIGQQLITSAGASSGPYAGAGMCIMSALVPFVIKKKFRFE